MPPESASERPPGVKPLEEASPRTGSGLDTPVQYLKGVGPRWVKPLEKLGLFTVRDVLHHLPRRYEDRRNIPPIRELRPGQWATVRGVVDRFEGRPTRRGMVVLRATLRDRTGSVTLTWFNQPWIRRQLEGYDGEIFAYGQVKEGDYGYEIHSPEYELIGDEENEDFARIIPVYPLTEGVSQKTVRRAVLSAVQGYLQGVEDPLPSSLLRKYDLQPLDWSLREIHQPSSEEHRLAARRRLVFEEFFYLQLTLAMRRAESQIEAGITFPVTALLEGRPVSVPPGEPASNLFLEEGRVSELASLPLWDQVRRMLPFELTGAQKRVIEEVWRDMERPHPMNRLVQGDVGAGKTAVAACAMLAAVRGGYQAALMAPTEILAEQHAAGLARLFDLVGIEVVLLVGKQTATQRRKALEKTRTGQAAIAVGTHAIIQSDVEFARLGLVVIDEQHRFGVLQRAALREKGAGNPDVLVMTATPIPRTLTMALFGDLDVSVIEELPPGRKPIRTYWKPSGQRAEVMEGVRKLVEGGKQAYIVCPMVSESEKMQAQAAEELYRDLVAGTFRDLRVGLLHGQMKPKDKEEVMERFRAHELDVLVSTTVIEVGVDVPNATAMVIEDANRFGLSQLHQLRGRVGRGADQSFCVLVADARTEDARSRMAILQETTDGFKIAEEDLRLRGPGELIGTRQSGNLDFKIADLVIDGKMLEVARQAAMEVVAKDPHLAAPSMKRVAERLREERSDLAVLATS